MTRPSPRVRLLARCAMHDRPLVRTHGGSDICLKCFFERMRKQRSERVSMTDKPEYVKDQQREYSAKYYREQKAKA